MYERTAFQIFCLAALLTCSVRALAQGVPTDTKLTGTVIGSRYSYSSGSTSSTVNTRADAFDGDASTYFAAWEQSMGWAGLDMGTKHVITRIGILPRDIYDGPKRTLLGVFEGANSEDFMDAVPLYLISEEPSKDKMTYYDVKVTRGFRYVRYVGPSGTRSNVAELEFYGHEGEGVDSIFYQVTELPTVSIHIVNNYVPSSKGVDFDSNITITYENGTLIQEYPILTRVRGNFSASHENKPYRIKFNDGKKHHMLKGSLEDESPAKAKKWTLINNYGDKTLFRNNVCFEVSKRIGMPFTPYCRCVDLLLNGEYRGCYQLTDHVSSNEERINITEMEPEEIEGEELTGGYLIEMNGYADSDPKHFYSNRGNPITVHEPDEDVIQPQQFQYIRDHFNRMEDAVFSSNYTDPETGYRPLLDLDSFLKYFLANEFSGNTDMLWQVFMYKERGDDHIYTGPVWDNDLSLDNDAGVFPGNQREDWTYTIRAAGQWRNFVSRVLSDPYAMARLETIWAELRDKKVFTKNNIEDYVEKMRRKVSASARLNFIRWPYLTQKIHCNPAVWGTWDAEVDVVRDYVGGRVEWMDNKLNYNKLDIVDGIYLIKNPLQLTNFASIVNNGNTDIKGELTTDIDMQEFESRFTPIGSTLKPFKGSFDGKQHTIKNLHVVGSRYAGFFGAVTDGAKVANLTIDKSCSFEGIDYIGGLVGRAQRGTVEIINCGNEADVKATGSRIGGLVGGGFNADVNINNSYNAGQIIGLSDAAALVGWSNADISIKNSYNIGEVEGAEEGKEVAGGTSTTLEHVYDLRYAQASPITENQLTSGELCWTLNQQNEYPTWFQNLDNGALPDTHPVLQGGHGSVFYDNGLYSNINPNGYYYRYYLLDISKIKEGNIIQLSEVDLLNTSGMDIEDMKVYEATRSTIAHEDWPNIADNSTSTKFCSAFNGRSYFLFDALSEVEITGYRLFTANDTQGNSGRNPISWKLYGTNTYTTNPNDKVWELIDERTNDYTLGATNYTPYDFDINWPMKPVSVQMVKQEMRTVPTAVYDLSGRCVAGSMEAAKHLPKGIYIVGGKKVAIGN